MSRGHKSDGEQSRVTLFAQFLARGRQQCRVQWRAVLNKMTVTIVVEQGMVRAKIFLQDTRRRVKLYELNAERQWDDKGTGEILAECFHR